MNYNNNIRFTVCYSDRNWIRLFKSFDFYRFNLNEEKKTIGVEFHVRKLEWRSDSRTKVDESPNFKTIDIESESLTCDS